MKIIATENSRRIQAFRYGGPQVQVSANLVNRIELESSTVEETYRDKVFLRSEDSTVVTDYQLIAEYIDEPDLGATWVSLTPAIATVVDNSKAVFQSPGVGIFRLITIFGSYLLSLNFTRSTGQVAYEFDRFVANTVSSAMQSEVAALATGETDKDIFTTQNHAAETYVRNASCWGSSLDLTGISPWNSRQGVWRAGTLLTDDIIVFASHYPLRTDDTVRFVGSDNTVVNTTLTATRALPYTDISVGRLASSVPAGIKRYPVMPANYAQFSSDPAGDPYDGTDRFRPFSNVHFITTDQEEKLLLRKSVWLKNFPNLPAPGDPEILVDRATAGHLMSTDFPDLTEDIITGDSGNPVFALTNNELVLLGCHWFPGNAPHVGDWIPEISALIADMGSSTTLTTADLSGFTDFS